LKAEILKKTMQDAFKLKQNSWLYFFLFSFGNLVAFSLQSFPTTQDQLELAASKQKKKLFLRNRKWFKFKEFNLELFSALFLLPETLYE